LKSSEGSNFELPYSAALILKSKTMNKNSLSAYFDESNQRTFKSHKARIVRYLSRNPLQTTHQVSANIGLTNEQANKRLSDSDNSDIFEAVQGGTHNGNPCALYRIKEQLSMFPVEKKISLRKWLENEYPEILHKYELLINHKL